jgi:hypothetical protein
MVTMKKAMASPRMNDPNWLAGLSRAKASIKLEFTAIHVVAPLRDDTGVAPVVLQTRDGFWRPPVYMEAAFELCLRHLHRLHIPGPNLDKMTPQALLANRAMEALKLPGRYVPTVEGGVLVMEDANCQAGGQAPSVQQIVAPEAAESEDDQSDAGSQAMATEDNEDYRVAEPHVEAAESSEVPKNDVEALPPSQPDGGHSVAESLVDWGEAEQAGVKPSTGPSDCEAEQAVEPSIANKPDDVQAASKAQVSASKAFRRRAAQKARKRRGK